MNRILLLEGHTIETLPVLKSLSQKGFYSAILCDNRISYGNKSRYAQKVIVKPDIRYDSALFLEYFLSLQRRYSFDIVIPMYDSSAEFLSKNRDVLTSVVKFVAPEYKVFENGFKKNKLMYLCEQNNLPHPRTWDIQAHMIHKAVSDIGFPLLIKPNVSSGGRGIKAISDMSELEEKLPQVITEFGECTLQEYIPSGGKQYKVQLFRTTDGRISQATVLEKIRFYPEKGGSSCFSKTINRQSLVFLVSKVLELLGWEGFADFDLIEDPRDNTIKIMEINPRFPACIKASMISGVDFAEMYVDYSLGKTIKNYKYSPGKYLRYLGLDVLWFFHSKNRFKCNPSWFTFFGRDVYYQDGSLHDPMPFLFGTFAGLSKLFNPQFRKSKDGLRS